jgi:hypothetical protein
VLKRKYLCSWLGLLVTINLYPVTLCRIPLPFTLYPVLMLFTFVPAQLYPLPGYLYPIPEPSYLFPFLLIYIRTKGRILVIIYLKMLKNSSTVYCVILVLLYEINLSRIMWKKIWKSVCIIVLLYLYTISCHSVSHIFTCIRLSFILSSQPFTFVPVHLYPLPVYLYRGLRGTGCYIMLFTVYLFDWVYFRVFL